MKKLKAIFTFFIIIGCMLSLTGCWDIVELEDRGFVLGIALDKGDNPDEIVVTYQIAIPNAMYGQGGGKEKKVLNMSTTDTTVMRANKQALTRNNKVLNLEHVQVLVIGEELAKEGISKHMDFFFRDINFRRKTDVLVAEGKAKDALDIEIPTALSSSEYIGDIMHLNGKRVHRISADVDLLELTKSLRIGTDFALAKITVGKNDTAVTGGAVFRVDKMVGFLTPDDVKHSKWLMNNISEATMVFKNLGGVAGDVVFEIRESNTQVKPRIQGEQVNFDVNIRCEGVLVEQEELNFKESSKEAFLSTLEQSVEEQIKKECQEILSKAQNEYDADFFNFGHIVKNANYTWWQGHEAQWRDIFKRSQMNVNVDAYARRVGLTE